jgi:hypothetical protein
MTWYPKVSSIKDNGFGGSRNGQPINGVVIHHVAGTNGLGRSEERRVGKECE